MIIYALWHFAGMMTREVLELKKKQQGNWRVVSTRLRTLSYKTISFPRFNLQSSKHWSWLLRLNRWLPENILWNKGNLLTLLNPSQSSLPSFQITGSLDKFSAPSGSPPPHLSQSCGLEGATVLFSKAGNARGKQMHKTQQRWLHMKIRADFSQGQRGRICNGCRQDWTTVWAPASTRKEVSKWWVYSASLAITLQSRQERAGPF